MSIGNLQKILLHDIHNLLCDLILKHESTSPEFIWGFQCSLLGSKIHYLGQEKSNSLHGSTQVVNIHYLGQIHNLGQNSTASLVKTAIPSDSKSRLWFEIEADRSNSSFVTPSFVCWRKGTEGNFDLKRILQYH